jgi:response regulator RpfG family c-di-GMP phosphodiesterase
MNDMILFVDDDANVLSAYQRQLRKQFSIDTAPGPEQGLEALARRGPYAVVVSDMNMPGMDGVQFLARARDIAPDTVRMMLTGNASLNTAIDALKEGNIFRFLTKPCPPEILSKSLQAGIEQYRLIKAERDLLEKTLSGSIKVLTDILSMVDPESFGRAVMLRDSTRTLAKALKVPNLWEVVVAAMVAQIGCVTIPPQLTAKARSGQPLSPEETLMLSRVPEIGRNLLGNIPRLESVAKIVLYQNKRFDGSGFPQDAIAQQEIPLGSRILKILSDMAQLESSGMTKPAALKQMRTRVGWYDPDVLGAAVACFASPTPHVAATDRVVIKAWVKNLCIGQVLMSDVTTQDDTLLISAGHTISETLLEKIKNYAQLTGIKEPIYVETVAAESQPTRGFK